MPDAGCQRDHRRLEGRADDRAGDPVDPVAPGNPVKLAYFVHNLNDPAVYRRVRMLHAAGVSVVLLGFCRGEPPQAIEGIAPLLLGRTEDAHLSQRAVAVLRGLLALPRWRGLLAGTDAIIARQLETLVLAACARRIHAPDAPLVFECLDTHRLMGAPGPTGWLLRFVEQRLLARCQGLLISAPDFIGAHFARVHARLGPVTLIENKVLSVELADRSAPARLRAAPRAPGPPWRIGWYGMIRCARSLRLLAGLAAARPGTIEVVIGGRVADWLQAEFDAVLVGTPGMIFTGPYDRRHDLARMYGAVHFAWTVDYYEAGANSDWLLPNRLYEAGLFGAIPIARAEAATGAWLAQRGVGALLHGDPAHALDAFFGCLDTTRHAALAGALAMLPDSEFLYTAGDCETLVRRLTETRPKPAARSDVARCYTSTPYSARSGVIASITKSTKASGASRKNSLSE
jgi:succinoglycan biosynthesis protein ExoL